MSVIRTDKWLQADKNPLDICENLTPYFRDTNAADIFDYFVSFGMYLPSQTEKDIVTNLQNNSVWEVVEKEYEILQQIWDGPNIPIFIFPADPYNPILKQETNGKSGLSFHDKLFLFISENNMEQEIRALFIHEYNHVCRLSQFSKQEKNYVLLDTIILEGLAERAVFERLGKEAVSEWVTYYTNQELERMWNLFVHPNINVRKTSRKHQDILYGSRFFPKMTGYCIGYYLVTKYLEINKGKMEDLLCVDSSIIAQIK